MMRSTTLLQCLLSTVIVCLPYAVAASTTTTTASQTSSTTSSQTSSASTSTSTSDAADVPFAWNGGEIAAAVILFSFFGIGFLIIAFFQIRRFLAYRKRRALDQALEKSTKTLPGDDNDMEAGLGSTEESSSNAMSQVRGNAFVYTPADETMETVSLTSPISAGVRTHQPTITFTAFHQQQPTSFSHNAGPAPYHASPTPYQSPRSLQPTSTRPTQSLYRPFSYEAANSPVSPPAAEETTKPLRSHPTASSSLLHARSEESQQNQSHRAGPIVSGIARVPLPRVDQRPKITHRPSLEQSLMREATWDSTAL